MYPRWFPVSNIDRSDRLSNAARKDLPPIDTRSNSSETPRYSRGSNQATIAATPTTPWINTRRARAASINFTFTNSTIQPVVSRSLLPLPSAYLAWISAHAKKNHSPSPNQAHERTTNITRAEHEKNPERQEPQGCARAALVRAAREINAEIKWSSRRDTRAHDKGNHATLDRLKLGAKAMRASSLQAPRSFLTPITKEEGTSIRCNTLVLITNSTAPYTQENKSRPWEWSRCWSMVGASADEALATCNFQQ